MHIENRIDKISHYIGKTVAWFTTILVLVVVYDVFTRYFLLESSVALQEMTWHIFSIIFLLGASYTLKEDAHVRVDIFYQKFSDKSKAVINSIGVILFVIPFCVVLIITSTNWTINSYMINEVSPDQGGLPFRFLIKAVLPLSFVLVLLQSLALLVSSIKIIVRK